MIYDFFPLYLWPTTNPIIAGLSKQQFFKCFWWIRNTLHNVTHFCPLWTVPLFTIGRMDTSRWHLHGRRDSLFKHTVAASGELAPGRFIMSASWAQQLAQSHVLKVHFGIINPPRLMQHHTSSVWRRTWSLDASWEGTDISLGVGLSGDRIVDGGGSTIRYEKQCQNGLW